MAKNLTVTLKMGKHKGWCSKCNKRHFPPTGKKCQEVIYEQSAADETMVKPKKKGSKIDSRDSQLSKSKISSSMSPHGQPSFAHKQDFHIKRASTTGLEDQSDSEDGSDSADGGRGSLQLKIFGELKKVSSRLDIVEQQVADGGQRRCQEGKKDLSKLTKRCDSKYSDSKHSDSKSSFVKRKKYDSSSDSSKSDDDCDIPIQITLRSSKAIQKHISGAIAELEKGHATKGKDPVTKSKRGGGPC